MPSPKFTERELGTLYEWAQDARNAASGALERYRRDGLDKPENALPVEIATEKLAMALAILKKLSAPAGDQSTSRGGNTCP